MLVQLSIIHFKLYVGAPVDGTVEGGRSDFEDKNVQDDSLVTRNMSLGEPSTAGMMKTGKLHCR